MQIISKKMIGVGIVGIIIVGIITLIAIKFIQNEPIKEKEYTDIDKTIESLKLDNGYVSIVNSTKIAELKTQLEKVSNEEKRKNLGQAITEIEQKNIIRENINLLYEEDVLLESTKAETNNLSEYINDSTLDKAKKSIELINKEDTFIQDSKEELEKARNIYIREREVLSIYGNLDSKGEEEIFNKVYNETKEKINSLEESEFKEVMLSKLSKEVYIGKSTNSNEPKEGILSIEGISENKLGNSQKVFKKKEQAEKWANWYSKEKNKDYELKEVYKGTDLYGYSIEINGGL